MPYGITQCFLPPDRADIPALTPAEAGTRCSDPGARCYSLHRRIGRYQFRHRKSVTPFKLVFAAATTNLNHAANDCDV